MRTLQLTAILAAELVHDVEIRLEGGATITGTVSGEVLGELLGKLGTGDYLSLSDDDGFRTFSFRADQVLTVHSEGRLVGRFLPPMLPPVPASQAYLSPELKALPLWPVMKALVN